jgi:hypothetical protein
MSTLVIGIVIGSVLTVGAIAVLELVAAKLSGGMRAI